MKFLDKEMDRSLQCNILNSSYEHGELGKSPCHKCTGTIHKTSRCPSAQAHGAKVCVEEKRRQLKTNIGACPLCAKCHTYLRGKYQSEWPTDRLAKCDEFVKMTLMDRARGLVPRKSPLGSTRR